jgi:hypothetical protein
MGEFREKVEKVKYDFIKIANRGAEENLYRDKRVAHIDTGEMACVVKSCMKLPQTVCEGCLEYVCENHVHRHPNCEQGR